MHRFSAYLILWAMTYFAVPTFGKPVVLHVAIQDNGAVASGYVGSMKVYLQKNLPDVKVVTVTGQAEQTRANLSNLILDPEDTVEMIVIDTHGDTHQGTTRIKGIGTLGTAGLDHDFASFFAPVKAKASSNLRIVFNTCHTMAGSDDEAVQTAKGLLEFFDASNGSVYASSTFEDHHWRGTHHLAEGWMRRVLQVYDFVELLNNAQSILGLHNRGRLMEFKDGKLNRLTHLSKLYRHRHIFSLSGTCEQAFESK